MLGDAEDLFAFKPHDGEGDSDLQAGRQGRRAGCGDEVEGVHDYRVGGRVAFVVVELVDVGEGPDQGDYRHYADEFERVLGVRGVRYLVEGEKCLLWEEDCADELAFERVEPGFAHDGQNWEGFFLEVARFDAFCPGEQGGLFSLFEGVVYVVVYWDGVFHDGD